MSLNLVAGALLFGYEFYNEYNEHLKRQQNQSSVEKVPHTDPTKKGFSKLARKSWVLDGAITLGTAYEAYKNPPNPFTPYPQINFDDVKVANIPKAKDSVVKTENTYHSNTFVQNVANNNLMMEETNGILRAMVTQMEISNQNKLSEMEISKNHSSSLIMALASIQSELKVANDLALEHTSTISNDSKIYFEDLSKFFNFLVKGKFEEDGQTYTTEDINEMGSPYYQYLQSEYRKTVAQEGIANKTTTTTKDYNEHLTAIATSLASLAEVTDEQNQTQTIKTVIDSLKARSLAKTGEYHNFKNTASVTDTVGQTHKVREVEAKATAEAHLKNRELNEMDFSGLENIPKDLTDIASLVLSDFKNVDGSLKFFDKPHKLVNADFSENPNEVV